MSNHIRGERSIPRFAVELVNTGLFLILDDGSTAIRLILKDSPYMIIFPRTIEVSKKDVFWQKSDRSSRKLYIRSRDLSLTFLGDTTPDQIPIPLLEVFESVTEEMAEKLAFHLDILPE